MRVVQSKVAKGSGTSATFAESRRDAGATECNTRGPLVVLRRSKHHVLEALLHVLLDIVGGVLDLLIVAHGLPQHLADLGEPRRPEDDQRHDYQDQQFCRSQSEHFYLTSPS